MSSPALFVVGSVFRLREHSDFCYITKITDKQIQYKPCVESRVSSYTHLEGTLDYAYEAKLLPSSDSVKPCRMSITSMHPRYFTDWDNNAYGMIHSTIRNTTMYPYWDSNTPQ